MKDTSFIFNGINGATGDYLLSEMNAADVAKIALGEKIDQLHRLDLEARHGRKVTGNKHMGPEQGVDPKDLAQSGWGVIFAQADSKHIDAWKEALKPLLNLRKEQANAGDLYKEMAYESGESKGGFLSRHDMGPGPAVPEKVSYYLLIVGSPESIPYSFQYQLDVQYAVGRIYFNTLEDYHNYAMSVLRAELGEFDRSAKAAFFGVQNSDDRATKLSATQLVQPLAEWMKKEKPNWDVETRLGEKTYKADLKKLLNSEDGPVLLFTASHGMWFPNGDPLQQDCQGALLCQDWPGREQWGKKPIPKEHYFSADDVRTDANLNLGGMINFHFACYGAGTPQQDDFAHQDFKKRADIAPYAFMASLPQNLLSHPNGGTLAVIAHVERVWGCSYLQRGAGAQRAVFESTLKRLIEGHPVGSAVEYFNEKYAELSTDLTAKLKDIREGGQSNDFELAEMWTGNNDARSYVIIGDPAIRLPTSATGVEIFAPPPLDETVLRSGWDMSEPATEQPRLDAAGTDATFAGEDEIGVKTDTKNAVTVTTSTAPDVQHPEGKKIAVQTKIDNNGMETVIAEDHAGNSDLLTLHRESLALQRALVEKTADARTGDLLINPEDRKEKE